MGQLPKLNAENEDLNANCIFIMQTGDGSFDLFSFDTQQNKADWVYSALQCQTGTG